MTRDIGEPHDHDHSGPSEGGASLAPESLGNAPIVFSSEYATIQAALDAAGGGKLLIDDIKAEEGIEIGPENDGVVIEWVGGNWVEQPQNYTAGVPVFHAEDAAASEDVTFVRPHIRNPNLGDADITDEDTVAGADRASAIESGPPNVAPTSVKNWRIYGGEIHHVDGYGVAVQGCSDSLVVRDLKVYQTTFDGVYEKPNASDPPNVLYSGCTAADNGRHNFTAAGTGDEQKITIAGCVGRRAYTSGIDIEQGAKVHVDAAIYSPSQSGGTANVDSGLNIDGGTGPVSGYVYVEDPQNYAASIGNGPLAGLTIESHQSAAQNPNDTRPVAFSADVWGEATVHVEGGGSTGGSVYVLGNDGDKTLDLDVTARNVFGPAVHAERLDGLNLTLNSVNPCKGTGLNSSSHLYLHTVASNPVQDSVFELVCIDNNGNAAYAVDAGDGGHDYNRYSGNVRGAYTTGAFNGVGANSQTGDVIT